MNIKGKYLELKDGTRPLLLLGMPKFSRGFPITGAVETITGHKKSGPYKNYGGPIDGEWWNSFKAKMRGYKKMNMVVMLHFWNALWFRKKGLASLAETIWYINDSVTDSKSLFFSEKSLKMQIELMEKCISFCYSINLEVIVTRGWEWHTLAGDNRATKWVKETGKAINRMGHFAFIHSHDPRHANIADGITVEGDYTVNLLAKHGLSDYKKPVVRFMNNPDEYKSGNPHRCEHGFDTESVINLLRAEAFADLFDRQATGIAYPRWFDRKVMEADLEGHAGVLKGYNYQEVRDEMMIFYGRVYHESFGKEGRFVDIKDIDFNYIIGKKNESPAPAPAPKPAPKPKPKDEEKIKTEPIKVEPKEKEMNNKNPWAPLSLYNLAKSYLSRWWALLIIIPAGVILGVLKAPWWVGLLVSLAYLVNIRLTERRVQKNHISPNEKLKSREIEPGDYVYSEPVTTLEKPDKCPGE